MPSRLKRFLQSLVLLAALTYTSVLIYQRNVTVPDISANQVSDFWCLLHLCLSKSLCDVLLIIIIHSKQLSPILLLPWYDTILFRFNLETLSCFSIKLFFFNFIDMFLSKNLLLLHYSLNLCELVALLIFNIPANHIKFFKDLYFVDFK